MQIKQGPISAFAPKERETQLMRNVAEKLEMPLDRLPQYFAELYNKGGLRLICKTCGIGPATAWYWLGKFNVTIYRIAVLPHHKVVIIEGD